MGREGERESLFVYGSKVDVCCWWSCYTDEGDGVDGDGFDGCGVVVDRQINEGMEW